MSNIPSREELEGLINQFPLEKVAEIYNISERTVSRWIKRYDLPKRSYKLDLYKATKIRRLYFVDGLSLQEIAKLYNVTHTTIGRIVNDIIYKDENLMSIKGNGVIRVSYRY